MIVATLLAQIATDPAHRLPSADQTVEHHNRLAGLWMLLFVLLAREFGEPLWQLSYVGVLVYPFVRLAARFARRVASVRLRNRLGSCLI